MGRLKQEFQKSGAAVIAISNEDGTALKQMQDREKADFITFLSDRNGEAARKYAGVYTNGVLKPGTFVIDRKRRISFAYENEDYRIRAAAEEVLDAVRKAAR